MLPRLPLIAISLCFCSTTLMADPASPVTFSGDIRLGYFSSERDDRNGSESEQDDARIRVRAGLVWAGI
ncbi:MAG: hypothetical protein Q7I91_03880 [Moraxellaceae bacterium]|nr:hypothetical protein [Moraxellaceae bacterium]